MRLTVADAISPSYFVAIAAVQLGFFREEGIDMEFVFAPRDPSVRSGALKDGAIDFFVGSPYTVLRAFPGWRGGVLLCALSHYAYWFLAIRSDIKGERGDVSAVKGLRLSAAADPGLTMKRLLEEAGIDFERDNVQIVRGPRGTSPNYAWDGVDAIEQGLADGYWGNGLRADLGVKRGIAKILLDVRRGDGPPAARHWTFPALITTERLVREHPDIAAGAVRAIVKTQRALQAEPQLAAKAAQRLFPSEEAGLIAYEVARDAPFYNPTITEEMVGHISRFAREIGALEGEVRYGELVATQFAPLWQG
ncbi:MAG: ABC transporter substrate-binding protein [candidate division NC10 bacterium]|nr:ABC transporter substrate-binding protein [candidate division NC10 bacterium]